MKHNIEEQALSRVLKRATIEVPNSTLTHYIIEQLQIEDSKVSSNELLFLATLKKAKTATISTDLTHKIISQLESKKKKSIGYRPLISRNVKYSYATLMSIGICYLIFKDDFYLSSMLTKFDEFAANFALLYTCFFSLVIFAFLDVALGKSNYFRIY